MKNKTKLPDYVKTEFSLTDTNIVKGVAVCLLLFYHCFLDTAYAPFKDSINFFPVSEPTANYIVSCLKLCVGMFAFLSGYGMFVSISKIDYTFKNIRCWIATRLAKMMSGFYFVYWFVFIISMIVDRYPITRYWSEATFGIGLKDMILDNLGLASLFQTNTLISTWWYMSMAIIFVLVFPIAFKFTQKLKYTTAIIVLIVLPRIIGYQGSTSTMSFMLALVFGMMFADYNLFEKLGMLKVCKNQKVSDIIVFVVMLALVVSVFYFNPKINWGVFCEFDFDIAPVIFICFTKLYVARIPKLRNALAYLGKHSMNIYYVHTFYRCTYLSMAIYFFDYSLAIWGLLMGISLLTSLLIEWLKNITRYNVLVNKVVKAINK